VRALLFSLILFAFSGFAPLPAAAVTGAEAAQVAASMEAADKKDWILSRRLAQQAGSQAAMDLYEWRLLSAGEAGWPQYLSLIHISEPPRPY